MSLLYNIAGVVIGSFLSGNLSGQPTFEIHQISNTTESAESLFIIDLDMDGDQDILGAAAEDDHDVIWWRNDGGNPIQWTKIIIDGSFYGAGSVYAADLNNDSLIDIIAGAKLGDQIAWWENKGGDPIVWTKHIVQLSYTFPHEVYATDLDLDGKTDILAASSGLNEITWWKNEGGIPITWTRQVIGSNFPQAKSVHTGDFNGDSLPDVVGASLTGNKILWWENDGGSPIQWTEHIITANFAGAHRVQAIDIDQDGLVDVLGTGYYANEIAWWKNKGGSPVTWTKQVIASGFARACIAMAIDLDNDGQYDVAGTSQDGDEVAWWRNEGGNPIVWTKHTIDGNFDRVWPLYAGDLDGDGDNDVVAASGVEGNNEVKWYENNLIASLVEPGYPIRNNAWVVISPNPASDFFMVSFTSPFPESAQIELYSGHSNKIKTLFSGKWDPIQGLIKVHISDLSAGIYLLKVRTGSNVVYKKIIIK